MHEKKYYFFIFLNREIDLKVFEIFLKMFWIFFNILEKTGYFNTRLVFYSVNIQSDIMQDW